MAPRLDFSSWWMRNTQKGTPVVVKMENPNFSVVEINGANDAFRPVEKNRGKNVKQVTWVLLLKAHRTVGCVTWLVTVLWDFLGGIKKRVIQRQGVAVEKGKLLFRIISLFLVISLAVLAFEVVSYLQGWHFGNHNLHLIETASD